MQVDAVGDSTQSPSALPAQSGQAASSDNCSAVILCSADPAYDGATSTPQQPARVMQCQAQHAQQAVMPDNLLQHPSLQHKNAAPSTSRHLSRKRKQPPSEEEQQHAGPSTSAPSSASAEQALAGSAEQDGLEPDLSHRRGKRKGSKASGGLTEAPSKARGRAAPLASGWPLPKLVVSPCTCLH